MFKKIIILAFLFLSHCSLKAQVDSTKAIILAQKIAQKMKDSLGLTQIQKNRIFTVNMKLYSLKKDVRLKNQNNINVITQQIQNIEKTRDGLYKLILNIAQYENYKLKKSKLITNN